MFLISFIFQFVQKQQVWARHNETIVNTILKSIWDGRESSTVEKYCNYLRKFLEYLISNKLSTDLPFTSLSVAVYITKLKNENVSKSSIDSTMAALKWIHAFIPGINFANNPMNDDFLAKIMSSSKRREATSKNQKMPILGYHICEMIHQSDLNDVIQLRDCLIVSLAYCLLLRHDEFSHLVLNHFEECSLGLKIFIPKSKTDKYRNGTHVLLDKSINPISPYILFKKYTSMVGLNIGDNHFLFHPLKKCKDSYHSENKILSYVSYHDIVKRMVTKIGLDPSLYGTHSLRSGGATALAPDVTEHELLVSGRWADSRSIRSYIQLSDEYRFNMNKMLQNTILNQNR